MRLLTVNNIKTEIIEIVMAFYCCTNIKINLEPVFGQLASIIELVAFVFENYILEFNDIVRKRTGNTITEDEQRTERKLMISWISLEILNELRNTEITY